MAVAREAVAVVVKLGGEVVQAPATAAARRATCAALRAAGTRVVVVHGGGPQATALQKRLGQTPSIVAGRRVTDDATLDVMKMVVAGKLNVDLCAALVAAGAPPVGLHGASALHRARRPAPAARRTRRRPRAGRLRLRRRRHRLQPRAARAPRSARATSR